MHNMSLHFPAAATSSMSRLSCFVTGIMQADDASGANRPAGQKMPEAPEKHAHSIQLLTDHLTTILRKNTQVHQTCSHLSIFSTVRSARWIYNVECQIHMREGVKEGGQPWHSVSFRTHVYNGHIQPEKRCISVSKCCPWILDKVVR